MGVLIYTETVYLFVVVVYEIYYVAIQGKC